MKSLLPFTLLAVGVLLAACEGQNPGKWQANPGKDYQSILSQAREKYSPTTSKVQPNAPDNTQNYCSGAHYFMTIDGQQTGILHFLDGKPGSHKLHIETTLNKPFMIKSINLPSGATISNDQSSGSVLDAVIAWTPVSGTATQKPVATVNMTVVAKNNDVCGNDYLTLDLFTTYTNTTPTVEIKGISTQVRAYAQDTMNIPFTVEVYDPTATAGKPPLLESIRLPDYMKSSEFPLVDAKDGVNCPQSGTATDAQHVVFNCSLDLSKLKTDINSGKTYSYVFAMNARSVVSGTESKPMPSPRALIRFDNMNAPVAAKNPVVQAGPTAPAAPAVEAAPSAPVETDKSWPPMPVPRPKDLGRAEIAPSETVASTIVAAKSGSTVIAKTSQAAPTVVSKVAVKAPVTSAAAPKSTAEQIKSDTKTAPAKKMTAAEKKQAALDKAQDEKQDAEEYGVSTKKSSSKATAKKSSKKKSVKKKSTAKPKTEDDASNEGAE